MEELRSVPPVGATGVLPTYQLGSVGRLEEEGGGRGDRFGTHELEWFSRYVRKKIYIPEWVTKQQH